MRFVGKGGEILFGKMTGSKQNLESDDKKSPRESGEDSEDDSEILEESPCGRWLKRKEEVEQRDVPGIDNAYLAMDTEEGVEVVWNEVLFSERKNFKSQEENIKFVFDNLTQLEHPNIVKFHKYWMDFKDERPRVIFITEYMSSGSLKQFLKRTKRNVKKLPLHFWKRWCTQILSALSYLHSCSPPIIHGNLTCDTIFIQHNGLVKIGSVAPDAIQRHVKTYRDNMKAMHFVAPEYEGGNVTTAADIFSFGMCALETAALEIPGNGDTGLLITEDTITKTLDSLNEKQQQDFIRECLRKDPKERPRARELLFHPVLFEVHSLKLLAAHCLIHHTKQLPEAVDEYSQSHYGEGTVIAEILHPDRPSIHYQLSDAPVTEKLEKFMEDVKFGIYPLTAFALPKPSPPQQTNSEPEAKVPLKSDAPDPVDIETRRILNMMCNVKPKSDGHEMFMTILLRLDDKMNRQLSCVVANSDSPTGLATELVNLAFINEADHDKVASLIEDTIKNYRFGLQSGVNSPETMGINDS